MSVTITGAAAAFLTVVGSGTSLSLAMSVDASTVTPGAYSYTLTETQNGYANSPNATSGTIIVSGSTDPIFRSVTNVPDRTAILSRTPPAIASAKQAFDPSDVSRFWVDCSQFLTDAEPLATIVRMAPSSAAAALGIAIDSGARRPVIDTQKKIIELGLVCSASSLTPFISGVAVNIDVTIQTGETNPATYHKTILITAKVQ